MPGAITRLFSACAFPSSDDTNSSDDHSSLWHRDLKLPTGDVSAAVVQANQVLEDQCLVESGRFGTFLGVFDGHGGPDAARFVCDHIFPHFLEISSSASSISQSTLRSTFLSTERSFLSHVSTHFPSNPSLATCGTCCLVGLIHNNSVLIANSGDSRAVLGRKLGSRVEAVQISEEHNANLSEVRREMKGEFPHDDGIVEYKHGVWRIKGIIQVSRSIGDFYMKYQEFNCEAIKQKFRISSPITRPILKAEPAISSRAIQPNDLFLIFASDGLWEHLTNQEAVDVVHRHPHTGSAKRLIKAALQEAAKKREMRYSDLISIDKKVRRHFHDDITAIVIFLNHEPARNGTLGNPNLSVRCPIDN